MVVRGAGRRHGALPVAASQARVVALLLAVSVGVDAAVYSQFTLDGPTLVDSGSTGLNGKASALTPLGTGDDQVCGKSWKMESEQFIGMKSSNGAPTGKVDFSISIYVKPVAFGERALITIGATDSPGKGGLWIWVSNSGAVSIQGYYIQSPSSHKLKLGVWSFLVLTYSAADNKATLYADAKPVVTWTIDITLRQNSKYSGMAIGEYHLGGSRWGRFGTWWVDHGSFANHVVDMNEVRASCLPPYVKCDDTGYSCPANYEKRPDANTRYCGTHSTDSCTTDWCCQAYCGLHTCAAGYNSKPAHTSIKCGDDATACTDGKCCDATCAAKSCDAGLTADTGKSGDVCGAVVGSCTDNECCLATCGMYSCPPGDYMPKSGSGATACPYAGTVLDGCTIGLCCDATCSLYNCVALHGGGYVNKAGSSTTSCGGPASACTQGTCCVPTCSTHTCGGVGMVPAAGSGTVPCASGTCTDGLCCEATCASYACATLHAGFTHNDTSTVCGTLASSCTKDMCCVETCDTHTCQQGHRLKSTSGMIECSTGPCDDALCCDAYCDYSMFGCDANYIRKNAPEAIRCGDTAASCTNVLCCDATCGTHTCTPNDGWGTLPAAAGNRCNGNCTDELCCAALCNNDASTCTAPNYEKIPSPELTQCGGGTTAECTTAVCCDLTCASHMCGPDTKLKGTAADIACIGGVCTDAQCCNVLCSESEVTCGTGMVKKSDAGSIECGESAGDCADSVCCDFTCQLKTCSAPLTVNAAKSGDRCGATLSTCTDELCCAVTCGHPDFSCPLGTAPLSEVENVTCGATAQSCNHTACCAGTAAPATGTPMSGTTHEPAPRDVGAAERQETAVEAALPTTAHNYAALLGAAAAGGFSAGTALRLSVAASSCREAIPRSVHPTGVEVDGSMAAGAGLANLGITAALCVLCLGVLKLVSLKGRVLCPRIFSEVDTQGLLRLPAVPLLLFQFFFQGMTLAGMNLVLHGDKVWHSTVGAAVVLLCLAVPVLTMRTVLRSVGVEAAYAVAVGRTNTPVLFLIGPGEWVNLTHKTMWVERYSTVVNSYAHDRTWFYGIEYAASFAVSALKATAPESQRGCGHVHVACAVVFAVMCVLNMAYWPHIRARDAAVEATLHGLQCTAMLMISAAYYRTDLDFWTATTADFLLRATVGLIFAKALLDVCAVAYLMHSGRRRRLQADVLHQAATPSLPPSPNHHNLKAGVAGTACLVSTPCSRTTSFAVCTDQHTPLSEVHDLHIDTASCLTSVPDRALWSPHSALRGPLSSDAGSRSAATLLACLSPSGAAALPPSALLPRRLLDHRDPCEPL